MLAGMTTALLRTQAKRGVPADTVLSLPLDVNVAVGVRKFPFEASDSGEDFDPNEILAGVINMLLPLASSFLLPVFVFLVVVEKELRLKAMMSMMGLRSRVYCQCFPNPSICSF